MEVPFEPVPAQTNTQWADPADETLLGEEGCRESLSWSIMAAEPASMCVWWGGLLQAMQGASPVNNGNSASIWEGPEEELRKESLVRLDSI